MTFLNKLSLYTTAIKRSTKMSGYPVSDFESFVDPQVQQWFYAVDTGKSGQICAKELQKALVNGPCSNFSNEACSMMIDMYDKDKTGKYMLIKKKLLNYWVSS